MESDEKKYHILLVRNIRLLMIGKKLDTHDTHGHWTRVDCQSKKELSYVYDFTGSVFSKKRELQYTYVWLFTASFAGMLSTCLILVEIS